MEQLRWNFLWNLLRLKAFNHFWKNVPSRSNHVYTRRTFSFQHFLKFSCSFNPFQSYVLFLEGKGIQAWNGWKSRLLTVSKFQEIFPVFKIFWYFNTWTQTDMWVEIYRSFLFLHDSVFRYLFQTAWNKATVKPKWRFAIFSW